MGIENSYIKPPAEYVRIKMHFYLENAF